MNSHAIARLLLTLPDGPLYYDGWNSNAGQMRLVEMVYNRSTEEYACGHPPGGAKTGCLFLHSASEDPRRTLNIYYANPIFLEAHRNLTFDPTVDNIVASSPTTP